jgi:tripartite-type tricarboxylate transporter receptor subunit TctC
MIRLKKVIILIATLLLTPHEPAPAQESYPTHPIRLVVGFAAGSSGDVAARIVSHKLGELLGQTMVV